MIPGHEELERLARQRDGRLADAPYPVLLHALARARASVTLELERGPIVKSIAVEEGVLTDCRSNLAHETLSRFMESAGLLGPDDAARLLAESFARNLRFGEVLLDHGLISPLELERVLQRNLARKLLDGFSWRTGGYRLDLGRADGDSSLRVKAPQLILLGVAKLTPDEEVMAAASRVVGQALARHPDPPFPADELTLSADQRTAFDALATPRRIDELLGPTGLSSQALPRALYALAAAGLVLPASELKRHASRPAATAAPPAPAPPAPAPATPAGELDESERERLRNELTMVFLVHRRLPPEELLGMGDDRSPAAAADAYLAFARRFAPWRFSGADADKARAVFLSAARAWASLAAHASDSVPTSSPPSEAAPPRRIGTRLQPIETDLLDPRAQFGRGVELREAGRLREALTQLEYAADLDPQNALYRTECARCRFAHDGPAGAERALAELAEVLRMEPGFGLALLYAGEIHAELGNVDTARGFLQRAIKPLAPDRRPIDALRALTVKT